MSNKNWQIEATRTDKAWEIITDPATGEIDYGDVRVGHIDTGYTRHRVFGPWDGTGNNLMTDLETNLIDPGETDPFDPMDYGKNSGHGTRIGAIMYGKPIDDFGGGIAPGCPVVPYRATNSVVLTDLTSKHVGAIGKAIREAVDGTDCDIVSMSLGTPGWPAKNMGRAVDHAYDSGVIVVAASGNNVSDHVTYPGKYFRSICAGGVTPERKIWREHEEMMRKYIDIFAPADEIYRPESFLTDDGVIVEGDLDFGDGTSYATACTAAAAALWLAHRGDEIDDTYDKPWMTIEAFRTMLQSTATPLAKKRRGVRTGILNVEGLLTADLPDRDSLEYEDRLAVKQRF